MTFRRTQIYLSVQWACQIIGQEYQRNREIERREKALQAKRENSVIGGDGIHEADSLRDGNAGADVQGDGQIRENA